MIFVKKHEKVLAVCDSDLIGKTLKEGKLCLKISERFYKGKEVTVDELKMLLERAGNVNIVGNESIKVVIELGFIKKDEVMYVEGIGHGQIVVL